MIHNMNIFKLILYLSCNYFLLRMPYFFIVDYSLDNFIYIIFSPIKSRNGSIYF